MRPVSPVIPNENHHKEIIVAEHQEEYQNLPCLKVTLNGQEVLLTRWKLNDEEIQQVIETDNIYVFINNFGQPVQPMCMGTDKPDLLYENIENN